MEAMDSEVFHVMPKLNMARFLVCDVTPLVGLLETVGATRRRDRGNTVELAKLRG